MSSRTREINRITSAIIRISVKLIVLALVILLMYEAALGGFSFGHQIFYSEAAERAPGREITVEMKEGESVSQAAEELAKKGLIKNEFAFLFQSRFYEYDTIYPGTYRLNTSMTSKEILQKLNEKPAEENAKTAQSEKAKAAAASETAAQSAKEENADKDVAAFSETGEKTGVATGAETENADSEGSENQDTATSDDIYGDEDQEEGGWIEDAPEGRTR